MLAAKEKRCAEEKHEEKSATRRKLSNSVSSIDTLGWENSNDYI